MRGADLTNKKFNKLTFIEPTDKRDKHRKIIWKIKCECGVIITTTSNNIVSGQKKTCGCQPRSKDLTGQKFGHLTFIKKTETKINNCYLWELKCDCGNIIIYLPSEVRRGHKQSCGCFRGNIKDYTGQKFNKLTFIRPINERNGTSVIWELLCDCGNTIFKRGAIVADGSIKSCGCAQNIRIPHRKFDPIISSARAIWHQRYKDCAFELFLELSQQNCHYCNSVPQNRYNVGEHRKNPSENQLTNGNFIYNGLDRIDSSIGHISNNIVPCCTQCNVAKMDYSYSDFLNQVKLIYENLQLQNFIKNK